VFLRRPLSDWDVATSAPPQEIKSLFHDIRNFSLKHGTVTLVHAGCYYEVSTYRGPEDLGKTIDEDLGHRDFTINAIAYDAKKRMIRDPYGGRSDIHLKLVRAVGDPKDRFREDPLRLLRALRIAAELKFRIEEKTQETILRMASLLSSVARERIRDELMKILMVERPSHCFNLMVRTQLLKQVIPELLEGYRKKQNHYHRFTIFKHIMETVDRVGAEPVLRLTALLHDIAKPRVREKAEKGFRFIGHQGASAKLAEEIMSRLKFSNDMIEQVTNLIKHHMDVVGYDPTWGDGALRRLVRRVGSQNMDRFLSFRRADLWAHGLEDEKLDRQSELETRIEDMMKRPVATTAQDLAVDGNRVMEILGISQGPEIGRILNVLMEKVTDRPELNTEEKLVDLLKGMGSD
jgi:putative nucleotidyltransferase with HDIG domain